MAFLFQQHSCARWWCCSAAHQVLGCSCCFSSAVPVLCPVLSAASRSPGLAWCSGALTLAQWHPPQSCSCKSSGKPRPTWLSGCGPWRSEPAPCLWKQRDTSEVTLGDPCLLTVKVSVMPLLCLVFDYPYQHSLFIWGKTGCKSYNWTLSTAGMIH